MPDIVRHIAGIRTLLFDAAGPLLSGPNDANDFVSAAWEHGASLIAIPTERLSEDFLELSNRRAGEAFQKFVNYGLRVAILGDLAARLDRSRALCDFVRESNKGAQLWFLSDRAALEARLAGLGPG